MKSVNLTFSKNSISSDSDLISIKDKTITIKDQKEMQCNFNYQDYEGKSLNIKLINSDVSIIERFFQKIKDIDCHIFIDKMSKLQRFSFLIQNVEEMKINRIIENLGFYESMQIDLSNGNVKCNETINLLDDDSENQIISAIYAQDENSKNYLTTSNHLTGNTRSNVQIFAISDNKAQVLINTDAYIKHGASKSKAQQEGRIINITSESYGSILPNLHIDENDVEASHSCSVGSVNKEHLYYLQTRGFSEQVAQSILIKSYFTPVLAKLSDQKLYQELEDALNKRIG